MALESRFPLHRNAGFQLPELRCKTDRNTHLIKRLGISANLLFYPESSSQDTELERFIGKYLSCNDVEREILLHTAEFMAEEFIKSHDIHAFHKDPL